MIIFPAIDIQNGECVRLTKGDFDTVERVADDPVQAALSFKEAGAEWLHMVDLDGAKTAQTQNRDLFVRVARETEMKIELGGGIRDMKTAQYYLENGIERIILGSIAIKNPKLLAEMVREYGERIVVGIDAQDGLVKIEGWQDSGRVNYITLAREMEYIGVQHVIFTDISRDGTLTGPNLADLRLLRDSVEMNVIASGGISNLQDIVALNNLKLYGAICGKSLYRGSLDLKEAIAAGNAEPEHDPIPARPAPKPEDKRKTVSFRPNTNSRPAAEEKREEEQKNTPPARNKQNGGGRQDGTRKGGAPKQQGGKHPPNQKKPPQQGNNRPAAKKPRSYRGGQGGGNKPAGGGQNAGGNS